MQLVGALLIASAMVLDGGCMSKQSSATRPATASDDEQHATAAAASHPFTNALFKESSPYLLQHAHNPVDWHAWGPEAFELARKQNKPIFLSIGYSTCYWCHVM